MNFNDDARQPLQNGQEQQQRVNNPMEPSVGWLQELFRRQQEMIVQQQQAFMVQQEKLISNVLAAVTTQEKPVSAEQIVDLLAGNIKEFCYDPEMKVTFAGWYASKVNLAQISSGSLREKFPRLFSNELGCCTKANVQLKLKKGATPVFRPKRPVAYAVLQQVESELERLEEEGIITKVDFSEWAAPIVVVRKANGTIRICGDYSTGLNNMLMPHQYPLPLPEEIFAILITDVSVQS
ncbi:uncharacterized protein LOC128711146 [Anopheles marshallii]|uniref:uncharacterized protein LOC128711146 n=1 Tax=Anopheles marshallii TaxID=1521116 RepID=UPI00237A37A7|nr:uncharacterized protein LOC128711146 [Anopheles marshallii]